MPIASTSLNQKIFVEVSEADQYGAEEGWFPVPKVKSQLFLDGKEVVVLEQKARHLPLFCCERILKIALAFLCTIASLGTALASKKIRQCFTGYQVVYIVAPSPEANAGRITAPQASSETRDLPFPNLEEHYANIRGLYPEASPEIQKEIDSILTRDLAFQLEERERLETFRARFGSPPPLGEGSDILAWNNITQYAFQILRERQGDLSEHLMDTILLQLEAFLKEYLTKYFEIHGLGGEEHRKERIEVVAKKRRAENVLWGKYGSFLVDDLGQSVNTPFPLGDSPYRDAFSECTSREFISRIWLFTQTYFEAENPLRGTRSIQDALVTALSYSESTYNGAIACHQGKCDQITVEVLNSRLNGMGGGDLALPGEELVKRAVDEFFNDPHQGMQHRNILVEEIAFSATIQEKILIEARLWYREKSIAVDQEAFEAELLKYAKNFYVS